MSAPKKAPKPFPFDAEYLRSVLNYDPETGHFTWRIDRGVHCKTGARAGSDSGGYVAINHCGRRYLAHRLAWLYMHGVEPASLIDHINRNGTDNRFCNLREATPLQNMWNTNPSARCQSGFRGVTKLPSEGKWRAVSSVNGVRKHLGVFASPEAASIAYESFVKRVSGAFAPLEYAQQQREPQ